MTATVDAEDVDHRAHERYHGYAIPPGRAVILRVDGRSFSTLTAGEYDKPFDARFDGCMRNVLRSLMHELGGVYGHTHSDEVSVLLPARSDLFGRCVEKLVSISAGIASSTFTAAGGTPAHFDSRVWVGGAEDVPGYFAWRQHDAWRNALHSACYWALRRQGLAPDVAHRGMEGVTVAEKMAILDNIGTPFDQLPAWAHLGVGARWETYQKPGRNPVTGHDVQATRRRLAVADGPPLGEELAELAAGRESVVQLAPRAPRTFALVRDEDVTGMSGTGTVAHGVEFADGTTVIRWVGDRPSTVIWDDITDPAFIHGHGGKTRIVWIGAEPSDG